jgi:hypothetical protein
LQPTPTPKLSSTSAEEISPTDKEVLGQSSDSAEVQIPTPTPQGVKIASSNGNNLLAKLLIFIGIVFLIACGIVVFYPYIVRFKNKNNE